MTESSSEISQAIETPEVSLTTFEIKFLSDSPDGFTATTRQSLRRHEPNTPMPEAQRIAKIRAGERKDLRIGEHFYPKIGLRNATQSENELSFDVMPVTFPTYIAIRKPHESSESFHISNPAATSMVLITTEEDGSHKLVFQHRSAKNRLYGDIPGSSIAGYLDATLDRTREGRGKILPITSDYIKDNVIREADEEIGIKPDEITELVITGLASDKKEIHDEFLLMGTTTLSSNELVTRTGAGDYFKFSEKFFTMDATPENIETLLTQVRCPLPPTHTATFLAAGYSMIVKQKGVEEAKKWKDRLTEGINKNYEEIDAMVKIFYQQHPEELDNVPTNKPLRNPNGYDAAYLPQEQGLPNAISEFERTGLIKKEKEKLIEEAYVFDVDGVLTVPDSRQFDREIMEDIVQRLGRGDPVILNTGRSISWVQKRIIARLYHAHNMKGKSVFQNLFVIGEKGGTWLTFDEEGMMHEHRDDSISVPQDLQDTARRIVEERFPKTMFFDKTKHTMVSIEMKEYDDRKFEGETTLEEFQADQEKLIKIFQDLLTTRGLDEVLKIDATTIATDIQNKFVGKDFAVKKALAWLATRGFSVQKFIAFGDSKSDVAMATELHENGQNVEFVFVGKNLDRDHIQDANLPFPIHFTHGTFNRGTAEFLKRE